MKHLKYKYKIVSDNQIRRIFLIHDPFRYHGVTSNYVREIQTYSNEKWSSNIEPITKSIYDECLELELSGDIIDV